MSLKQAHPLDQSEKTFATRMDMMHMGILKQTQGMHAPLRLMMERDAASRVNRPIPAILKDWMDGTRIWVRSACSMIPCNQRQWGHRSW